MMFGSFNRRLALNYCSALLDSKSTHLGILHFKPLLTIRCFSSNEPSFTVSYLINSCGLSPESAKFVSKNINFENPKNPDSVLSVFRDHGFTESQISRLVRKQCRLLLLNPEKIILPKIKFLRSVGVSSLDLPGMVARNPHLLACSLENHLIPCYHLLKSLLIPDEKVSIVLKRMSSFGLYTMKKNLTVNVSLLRELLMPQSYVSRLITCAPDLVCTNVDKFSENVKKVIGMGFDPSKYAFMEALRTTMQLNPKTLECKFDALRRWGLSDEEIWSVFKKYPLCMTISEKTIMNKMDFLVNKMGLQPASVAKCPIVFTYSLEKRIVPRCSVVKVLLLKGLIQGEINLNSVTSPSEIRFLDKFVVRYQEQVPELLDIFQGKIDLKQLGFGFDEKLGLHAKSYNGIAFCSPPPRSPSAEM